jgi:Kef-type K+ transport system membrane component KefB
VSYTKFISGVAHLGAVILLFVIGLEFDVKDLANPRYLLIGLTGVVVPLAAGYYVSVWLGYNLQSALFIAVALTATSVAITADTLREMGRLQTPAAKAIIGAAVADDVLALIALSAVRQTTAGEISLTGVGLILAEAMLFLVVGAWLGRKVLAPWVGRFDRTHLARRYPEVVFIFAMMLAFLYALVAEAVGLSAIVGSFLAGGSLEGAKLKYSKDFREGAEYLRIIFASVFFVSLGILVDITALDAQSLWLLLALCLVGMLTKLVGCGLPALWLGMGGRDAWAVGLGMAPRGEVAMIVALIGLDRGIIGQPVYVGIVAMSLVTTIIPPVIIRNLVYERRPAG